MFKVNVLLNQQPQHQLLSKSAMMIFLHCIWGSHNSDHAKYDLLSCNTAQHSRGTHHLHLQGQGASQFSTWFCWFLTWLTLSLWRWKQFCSFIAQGSLWDARCPKPRTINCLPAFSLLLATTSRHNCNNWHTQCLRKYKTPGICCSCTHTAWGDVKDHKEERCYTQHMITIQ
jgi:hypothetical protein